MRIDMQETEASLLGLINEEALRHMEIFLSSEFPRLHVQTCCKFYQTQLSLVSS